VIGMLDSRELLPYMMGYKRAKNINSLLYDINHYPASKELGELLNDFLNKKIQIAIVVDEYGGTAGVVSLKSILSELMGREFIEPEENRREEADIKEIEGKKFIISGDMQIVDYNFKFNDSVESNESETIGGYIIEKFGHIPRRAEILETDANTLTVRHMKKNRIESIELKMK
jgi:magnesium and cobalt transporter